MNKHLFFYVAAMMAPFALQSEEVAAPAPSAETAAVNTDESDLIDKEADQIARLSEAFGHMMAKHIESIGVNFDMASIIKGMQDAGSGKSSPMAEAECIEAITASRMAAHKALAEINLQKAESYMQETLKDSTIIALESGKLHYRIDRQGEGTSVVAGNKPLIRYVGKFIDGSVFGSSKTEDLITLDQTIPGFGKGLMGMKEGEKRTLYIHPDLAYGTMGQLPPNSTLIFEIELLKAHGETPQEVASVPVETAAPESLEVEEKTASLDAEKPTAIQ